MIPLFRCNLSCPDSKMYGSGEDQVKMKVFTCWLNEKFLMNTLPALHWNITETTNIWWNNKKEIHLSVFFLS